MFASKINFCHCHQNKSLILLYGKELTVCTLGIVKCRCLEGVLFDTQIFWTHKFFEPKIFLDPKNLIRLITMRSQPIFWGRFGDTLDFVLDIVLDYVLDAVLVAVLKGRVWYSHKFTLKEGKTLPDLAAIIFFPEKFISMRPCKTYSRDLPHALSKPSSCSLKTLLMLSRNPPPSLCSYSLSPPPTLIFSHSCVVGYERSRLATPASAPEI